MSIAKKSCRALDPEKNEVPTGSGPCFGRRRPVALRPCAELTWSSSPFLRASQVAWAELDTAPGCPVGWCGDPTWRVVSDHHPDHV